MKDHSAIFTGPLVLALMAGLKNQTRRLAWLPKKHVSFAVLREDDRNEYRKRGWRVIKRKDHRWHCDLASSWQKVKPGDAIWVRENARMRSIGPGKGELSLVFEADKDRMGGTIHDHNLRRGDKNPFNGAGWTPSIHMPRWASRITLLVTRVKIEPLQDISEADALAEGIPGVILIERTGKSRPFGPCALMNFPPTWDRLHGKGSWDANPEVVAVTFRVIPGNIDSQKVQRKLAAMRKYPQSF